MDEVEILVIDEIEMQCRELAREGVLCVVFFRDKTQLPVVGILIEVNAVTPGDPLSDYDLRMSDCAGTRRCFNLAQVERIDTYMRDALGTIPKKDSWNDVV